MTEKELQALHALNNEYQRICQKNPGTFLEKMSPEVLVVNLTENSIIIRFHSESWMSNPIGTVHGGIVAAMADIAMAGMGRILKETHRLGPTIHLNLEYLRPSPINQNVIVKAICHKDGHQFISLSCTAFAENAPEKTLFIASGCFANVSQANKPQRESPNHNEYGQPCTEGTISHLKTGH